MFPSDGTHWQQRRKEVRKYTLKRFFCDIEVPRLKQVAAEIETKIGKRVLVRYQMDGAGPHRDAKLLRTLKREFGKLGWIHTFQPATRRSQTSTT